MASEPGLYRRDRVRVGKLGLSVKLYQAVGAIPESLKNFAFTTFLLFYYNQILGLNALAASAAIAIALTIDAMVDPLVGSFSDSLRTRLGRRHLLMYLSAALSIGLGLLPCLSALAAAWPWRNRADGLAVRRPWSSPTCR